MTQDARLPLRGKPDTDGPPAVLYPVNVLLFLAAFFGVCLLLGPKLPKPPLDVLDPKLRHFVRTKDSYDAIFIGSSRVYRGIDPELFEDEMRIQGAGQARLFNFGVSGMRVPESIHLLKQILSLKPARLSWVLIELQNFDTRVDERNYLSDRWVWWHTWDETSLVWRAILAGDDPWPQKLRDIWDHGRHLLYRVTQVGRGSALLPVPGGRAGGASKEKSRALASLSGYLALEWDKVKGVKERREEFLENTEEYEQALERMQEPGGWDLPFTPYHQMVIDKVLELVDEYERPLQIAFVVMPGLSPETHFIEASEQDLIPRLVLLNDPNRFPFLYQTDQRWDRAHLKRPAAAAATRLFVRELLATLKEEARRKSKKGR